MKLRITKREREREREEKRVMTLFGAFRDDEALVSIRSVHDFCSKLCTLLY